MNTANTTTQDTGYDNSFTALFHSKFDTEAKDLMDPVREELLETVEQPSAETILAQLMMINLVAHPCDPDLAGRPQHSAFKGHLTPEMKSRLLTMATHMGPDYAQAIYHAAVFLTKVA